MNFDFLKSKYFWIIAFIIAGLIDAFIIVYVAYKDYTLLLYLIIVIALSGAYSLFNLWDQDERTDLAINEASRLVIKLFTVGLSLIGLLFILIGNLHESIIKEIGATLIVVAIFLIYLQAVISVIYENRMR